MVGPWRSRPWKREPSSSHWSRPAQKLCGRCVSETTPTFYVQSWRNTNVDNAPEHQRNISASRTSRNRIKIINYQWQKHKQKSQKEKNELLFSSHNRLIYSRVIIYRSDYFNIRHWSTTAPLYKELLFPRKGRHNSWLFGSKANSRNRQLFGT